MISLERKKMASHGISPARRSDPEQSRIRYPGFPFPGKIEGEGEETDLVVHSENTVSHPHMAHGARCSRGLPLCYARDLRPLAAGFARRDFHLSTGHSCYAGTLLFHSTRNPGVSPVGECPPASRNPRCALWPRELHTDTLPYSRNGVLNLRGLPLMGAGT